jgi:hypothetical protein
MRLILAVTGVNGSRASTTPVMALKRTSDKRLSMIFYSPPAGQDHAELKEDSE